MFVCIITVFQIILPITYLLQINAVVNVNMIDVSIMRTITNKVVLRVDEKNNKEFAVTETV